MSLQTYWTFVAPLLLLGAGAFIFGLAWFTPHDRQPKAGE